MVESRARSLPARLAVGFALAILTALAAPPPPVVLAAEPAAIASGDSANPLDAPIVDVALVGRKDRPEEPRLLTVADGPERGTLMLTLLERTGRRWRVVSELDASTGLGEAAERRRVVTGTLGRPWLVRLGPDRFAVVTRVDEGRAGLVAVVEADEVGLRIGPWQLLPFAIDGAGAGDVDGDGRTELVLVEATAGGGWPDCRRSRVTVADGSTLAIRFEHLVPGVRVGPAALANLDGQDGVELVTHAVSCNPEVDGLNPTVLVVVDPVAGSADEVDRPRTRARPLTGPPLAADLDADGRTELVVRSGRELVVLEPARGWRRSVVTRDEVVPVALRAADGTSPALIAAVGESGIHVAELVPSSSGFDTIHVDQLEPTFDPRWQRAVAPIYAAALLGLPPAGSWSLHDAGDCPALVMPLAAAWCGDGDVVGHVLRPGAAWYATRPIATVGAAGERRALIAEGVEWLPREEPRTPTPLAAVEVGGASWRVGPSDRFTLAEVRVADMRYFGVFPRPEPTMERVSRDRPAVVRSAGFAGTRLFASIRAGGSEPDRTGTLSERMLREAPSSDTRRVVARVPVTPGREAGVEGGVASIPLEFETNLPSDNERWQVTVVGLNVWGELSAPVAQTVARDVTGPRLALEAPMFSLPWPFAAPIDGSTEPGATVLVEGGGELEVSGRGAFEVRANLAPWPQTIVVRAVDAAGNETVERVSVVGGVDYRRLPWEWFIAVAILVGVSVATVRDVRRGTPQSSDGRPTRGAAWRPGEADPVPEVEDLPSGPKPNTV